MEKTFINTLIWSEEDQEGIYMSFQETKKLWEAWSKCESRFMFNGVGYNLDTLQTIWIDKDFWEKDK